MSKYWPIVKLGEVLRHRKEFITIDDLTIYKRPRIRLHVQGIVLRDEIPGALIKTKTQQVCRTGEFLVAEIDAKVGGFGIVPESLHGSIVSSHYFLFVLDESKLNRRFLDFFIRTPAFREQVAAQGSTNYAAIRPAQVLDYQIQLPPLEDQRRIVVRIEELDVQIHEARTLRHQAAEEAEAFAASVSTDRFRKISESHVSRPLGDTFSFRNDLIRPTDGRSGEIRFVGLQHVESNTGRQLGEDRLLAEELTGRKFRFSPGEIIYGYLRPYLNKVWLADLEGVCSVDQYVLKPKPAVTEARYLGYFLRSGGFLDQAIELTHNLMLPRLRSALLKGIQIPLPSLPEQRRIVAELDALQAEVDALKRLQTETAAEMAALLPAILDRAFKGKL